MVTVHISMQLLEERTKSMASTHWKTNMESQLMSIRR